MSKSSEPEAVENELQAFVTSSLVAIMKGVADAQETARAPSAHGTGEWAFSPPEDVTFDIAVVAKRTKSAKGGMKVEVFSIGANAAGDVAKEDSRTSRVQFKVQGKFKKRAKVQTKADR